MSALSLSLSLRLCANVPVAYFRILDLDFLLNSSRKIFVYFFQSIFYFYIVFFK